MSSTSSERVLRASWPSPGARRHVPVERRTAQIDQGLVELRAQVGARRVFKKLNPARVVVAVPVAAKETCEEFEDVVDETVCAVTPRPFHAVGLWYDDFSQTSDEEVREFLASARAHTRS